ncbi:hypothetical protein AVEN_234184-1 [Araneus ventricosus]|uniref:Uncharacterized protein n=1 Tax=Araneus ventricosus TaxID=182803 RepID=A0A4Y2MLC6_ARAVE|nr:hypothetical protein AVEN_234184-1 [Araneus ventricosus]
MISSLSRLDSQTRTVSGATSEQGGSLCLWQEEDACFSRASSYRLKEGRGSEASYRFRSLFICSRSSTRQNFVLSSDVCLNRFSPFENEIPSTEPQPPSTRQENKFSHRESTCDRDGFVKKHTFENSGCRSKEVLFRDQLKKRIGV